LDDESKILWKGEAHNDRQWSMEEKVLGTSRARVKGAYEWSRGLGDVQDVVCGESTWEVRLLGVIEKEEGGRSFPRREEHPFIPLQRPVFRP
jgi:hypothetical protein